MCDDDNDYDYTGGAADWPIGLPDQRLSSEPFSRPPEKKQSYRSPRFSRWKLRPAAVGTPTIPPHWQPSDRYAYAYGGQDRDVGAPPNEAVVSLPPSPPQSSAPGGRGPRTVALSTSGSSINLTKELFGAGNDGEGLRTATQEGSGSPRSVLQLQGDEGDAVSGDGSERVGGRGDETGASEEVEGDGAPSGAHSSHGGSAAERELEATVESLRGAAGRLGGDGGAARRGNAHPGDATSPPTTPTGMKPPTNYVPLTVLARLTARITDLEGAIQQIAQSRAEAVVDGGPAEEHAEEGSGSSKGVDAAEAFEGGGRGVAAAGEADAELPASSLEATLGVLRPDVGRQDVGLARPRDDMASRAFFDGVGSEADELAGGAPLGAGDEADAPLEATASHLDVFHGVPSELGGFAGAALHAASMPLPQRLPPLDSAPQPQLGATFPLPAAEDRRAAALAGLRAHLPSLDDLHATFRHAPASPAPAATLAGLAAAHRLVMDYAAALREALPQGATLRSASLNDDTGQWEHGAAHPPAASAVLRLLRTHRAALARRLLGCPSSWNTPEPPRRPLSPLLSCPLPPLSARRSGSGTARLRRSPTLLRAAWDASRPLPATVPASDGPGGSPPTPLPPLSREHTAAEAPPSAAVHSASRGTPSRQASAASLPASAFDESMAGLAWQDTIAAASTPDTAPSLRHVATRLALAGVDAADVLAGGDAAEALAALRAAHEMLVMQAEVVLSYAPPGCHWPDLDPARWRAAAVSPANPGAVLRLLRSHQVRLREVMAAPAVGQPAQAGQQAVGLDCAVQGPACWVEGEEKQAGNEEWRGEEEEKGGGGEGGGGGGEGGGDDRATHSSSLSGAQLGLDDGVDGAEAVVDAPEGHLGADTGAEDFGAALMGRSTASPGPGVRGDGELVVSDDTGTQGSCRVEAGGSGDGGAFASLGVSLDDVEGREDETEADPAEAGAACGASASASAAPGVSLHSEDGDENKRCEALVEADGHIVGGASGSATPSVSMDGDEAGDEAEADTAEAGAAGGASASASAAPGVSLYSEDGDENKRCEALVEADGHIVGGASGSATPSVSMDGDEAGDEAEADTAEAGAAGGASASASAAPGVYKRQPLYSEDGDENKGREALVEADGHIVGGASGSATPSVSMDGDEAGDEAEADTAEAGAAGGASASESAAPGISLYNEQGGDKNKGREALVEADADSVGGASDSATPSVSMDGDEAGDEAEASPVEAGAAGGASASGSAAPGISLYNESGDKNKGREALVEADGHIVGGASGSATPSVSMDGNEAGDEAEASPVEADAAGGASTSGSAAPGISLYNRDGDGDKGREALVEADGHIVGGASGSATPSVSMDGDEAGDEAEVNPVEAGAAGGASASGSATPRASLGSEDSDASAEIEF
eukprot:jgi/Tetstr1/430230/TSEL_020059.t1